MSDPVTNHLFVTAHGLVHGTARTGDRRLSDALHASVASLHVDDFRLEPFAGAGQPVVHAGSALVCCRDLILAHEYVDLHGDDVRRQLRRDDGSRRPVSLLLREPAGWEVVGHARPDDLRPTADGAVFVLTDCHIGPLGSREGTARPGVDVPESVRTLSHLIVRRTAVWCVLSQD